MNVAMAWDYYFECSLFVFAKGSWVAVVVFSVVEQALGLNMAEHSSCFSVCKCRQSSGPRTLT